MDESKWYFFLTTAKNIVYVCNNKMSKVLKTQEQQYEMTNLLHQSLFSRDHHLQYLETIRLDAMSSAILSLCMSPILIETDTFLHLLPPKSHFPPPLKSHLSLLGCDF